MASGSAWPVVSILFMLCCGLHGMAHGHPIKPGDTQPSATKTDVAGLTGDISFGGKCTADSDYIVAFYGQHPVDDRSDFFEVIGAVCSSGQKLGPYGKGSCFESSHCQAELFSTGNWGSGFTGVSIMLNSPAGGEKPLPVLMKFSSDLPWSNKSNKSKTESWIYGDVELMGGMEAVKDSDRWILANCPSGQVAYGVYGALNSDKILSGVGLYCQQV